MKKFLIATAALASVALSAPAIAADLPVKAPPVVMPTLYNWSGFYVGGIAGAVLGITDDVQCGPTFGPCDRVAGLQVGNGGKYVDGTNYGHNLHGGFLGGEVGFNWEGPSRWVWGLEADWSWSHFEDPLNTCPSLLCAGTPPGSEILYRVTDYGTARIRIGYAFGTTGEVLGYVTGGFAWGNGELRQDVLVLGTGNVNVADIHQYQWGGTVGGGIEYGITPYLSLKGEVLWIFLGEKNFHCGPVGFGLGGLCTAPAFAENWDIESSFAVMRAALNWRFNWGGPVVARY